jgi:hypothetical protein
MDVFYKLIGSPISRTAFDSNGEPLATFGSSTYNRSQEFWITVMKMTKLARFCAPIVLAGAAFGQVAPVFTSMSIKGSGDTFEVTFRGTPRAATALTGAAFSGDWVLEHTRTLADGTHISQNNATQHLFRDSQGRTRVERPLRMGPVTQLESSLMLIEVSDPVSGFGFVIDDQNKIVHRMALPAGPPARPQKAADSPAWALGAAGRGSAADPLRPQHSHESLGTQTIEGLICEGTRQTIIWPVASRGNDRPLTNTDEMWYSNELKLTVLSKSNSLENGESVTKLINVSRAEPNAALFQPPPNYTIMDEKESFTMTLKRP